MDASLAALPEQTLTQILGGLLLTHFRSTHPKAEVSLLREYAFGGAGESRADFVFYDEKARMAVAVFELVLAKSSIEAKQQLLRRYSKAVPNALILGLVMPQSLASPGVKRSLKKHGTELVTFPG